MPGATKKTAVAKKSKTTKKVVSKPMQSNTQNPVSTFFNNLRSKSLASSSNNQAPRVKRKYVLSLIGLVVLIGIAYFASRFLVVAWVDQRPIYRISYYNQLDKKYGKDLKEQLIVEALVEVEAGKRGLKVSEEEVDEEIKKIETEQGGASNLDQVLQMQMISRDELRNLVRLQILRQKMFADSGAVTEAEVDDYLVQNKANLPEADPKDASAAANLRNNVREQLRQQKLNATFSSWLQENLSSDRVIRL